MIFELSGKLIEKYDEKQVSPTFRKREFVLESSENYQGREFVNYLKFQLTQDRCSLIDGFELGDDLKVAFALKGNKWQKGSETVYFTNLEAIRIEKKSESFEEEAPPPQYDNDNLDYDDEDVPF